jgi:hypothetical protein
MKVMISAFKQYEASEMLKIRLFSIGLTGKFPEFLKFGETNYTEYSIFQEILYLCHTFNTIDTFSISF